MPERGAALAVAELESAQRIADIILTDTARAHLAAHFSLGDLPTTPVKGVARPLPIYSLVGLEPEEARRNRNGEE